MTSEHLSVESVFFKNWSVTTLESIKWSLTLDIIIQYSKQRPQVSQWQFLSGSNSINRGVSAPDRYGRLRSAYTKADPVRTPSTPMTK